MEAAQAGAEGARQEVTVRLAPPDDLDAVLALWGGARSAHAVTEDTPERVAALLERARRPARRGGRRRDRRRGDRGIRRLARQLLPACRGAGAPPPRDRRPARGGRRGAPAGGRRAARHRSRRVRRRGRARVLGGAPATTPTPSWAAWSARSRRGGAIRLGIADHLGWAIAVTVSAEHEVVDRRRIALIEPGISPAPLHYESARLDVATTAALVAEVLRVGRAGGVHRIRRPGRGAARADASRSRSAPGRTTSPTTSPSSAAHRIRAGPTPDVIVPPRSSPSSHAPATRKSNFYDAKASKDKPPPSCWGSEPTRYLHGPRGPRCGATVDSRPPRRARGGDRRRLVTRHSPPAAASRRDDDVRLTGVGMPWAAPSRATTPLRASHSSGRPASRSARIEVPASSGSAANQRRSRRRPRPAGRRPPPRATASVSSASARATARDVVAAELAAGGGRAPSGPRRRWSELAPGLGEEVVDDLGAVEQRPRPRRRPARRGR